MQDVVRADVGVHARQFEKVDAHGSTPFRSG
jgi:hypothetical protein